MDMVTLALIGGALVVATSKQGAYGQGSSKQLLTPGTYRVRFRAQKPQTNSLQEIWAIPNAYLAGTGMATAFESVTVDGADPNLWWFTGIGTYSGGPQTIDLPPGTTVQRL